MVTSYIDEPWEVIAVSAFADQHVDGTAPSAGEVASAMAAADTQRQLAEWMSAQRWYGGKAHATNPVLIGDYALTDASGQAAISVQLVLDEGETPRLYQVPLTARSSEEPELAHALVARHDGRRPLYLYDGPHDPAFAHALLHMILDGAAAPAVDDINDVSPVLAQGHRTSAENDTQIVSSRVLGGEQSNTSIVYEMKEADGTPSVPVICKLFRTLHHGENPDVVLLGALGRAGARVVPYSVGNVSGEWRDLGQPDGRARGHLAFAQEFLPGVEDAWRVTLRAAEEDRDFTTEARALGEATAEVHATLGHALGARECSSTDIETAVATMRRRIGIASREVPELAQWRDAIEAVYARAAEAVWPRLQRIHGDLHLGQVLAVPGRGWVLLDFEGEPMRPMTERSAPDIPLRDVAGMLRSFDYVAGAFALAHPGLTATDWAHACRLAFTSGYSAHTGHDLRSDRVLLDAFELDKAVYEAIYEARNRPEWLSIPVAAIRRLVDEVAAK